MLLGEFSILPVLIGFIIGILFVSLFKVHRWVKRRVSGFIVSLLTVFSIALIILLNGIWEGNIAITMSIMTLIMISWVTLIISIGNYSLKLTIKKLVVYFPLFIAFNIIVFETIGILGFSDPLLRVQLGYNISLARVFSFIAPYLVCNHLRGVYCQIPYSCCRVYESNLDSISLATGGHPETNTPQFLCFAVQFPTQRAPIGSSLWPLPIATTISFSSET